MFVGYPVVVHHKLKKLSRFAEVECGKQKSWAGIDADSIILMDFFLGGALHVGRLTVEVIMKDETQLNGLC